MLFPVVLKSYDHVSASMINDPDAYFDNDANRFASWAADEAEEVQWPEHYPHTLSLLSPSFSLSLFLSLPLSLSSLLRSMLNNSSPYVATQLRVYEYRAHSNKNSSLSPARNFFRLCAGYLFTPDFAAVRAFALLARIRS